MLTLQQPHNEFKLVVHTVFIDGTNTIHTLTQNVPVCRHIRSSFVSRKKTTLLPSFYNIWKANYIWSTLTRLTKHQKATRGHVCFQKSGEMNG